jgi:hypothetical protein
MPVVVQGTSLRDSLPEHSNSGVEEKCKCVHMMDMI